MRFGESVGSLESTADRGLVFRYDADGKAAPRGWRGRETNPERIYVELPTQGQG